MLVGFGERLFRRALLLIALTGLLLGGVAAAFGRSEWASWCWAGGTIPVVLGLLFSIIREFLAGRLGVDAVAFVSMSGALLLGQNLAGIVIAIMYAGGNILEDFAVARAERDLRSLIDRAPKLAHRRVASTIADVPIEQVAIGDDILVRAGEIIPVDGVITSPVATLDEAAVTGEPIPVSRKAGELARSGSLNAGDTFEIRASALANESTYAGIVRMVSAAQTAKAPFVRLADRYALLLLPLTLVTAGGAWLFTGDPIRALAVMVASTPCPLILAAPVAFIAGVAQAAKRGILVKGSGPLEALARTHTVMFDKTGTLTVGGARLVAIEAAPGQNTDDILRVAGSLEQASHHVVAATVVEAAVGRGLKLSLPSQLRQDHERMEGALDRLREIADALDHVDAEHASTLLLEADQLIARQIVEHERGDEFRRLSACRKIPGRPPRTRGDEPRTPRNHPLSPPPSSPYRRADVWRNRSIFDQGRTTHHRIDRGARART